MPGATGYFLNAFRAWRRPGDPAATKYYSGHSDVLIGLVIANEATWPQLKSTTYDLGQRASPDGAISLQRHAPSMGVP